MSFASTADVVDTGRPIVKGLFVASCILSVVSYYTTQQGMALYLSRWFSVLASLGVQLSLVLVAWLIGFGRERRPLLIVVYTITATVSIAFSYVSLFTWFSARERPALVQRQLYDRLNTAAEQIDSVLAAASAEGRKHVLALEEMTLAERQHGHIARAKDADPYLAEVREAVAREAATYESGYKEGAGEGVRYSAFDRYTKIAQQSLAEIERSRAAMAEFRSQAKPLQPSESQLRAYHAAAGAVPWDEVEKTLHKARLERPAVPGYAESVDQTASGQEDLLLAFQELFTAPSGRHIFSLALAAFIDILVFLLAYAAGPYFFASAEQRWLKASSAIDAADSQIFVRDLLRKIRPGPDAVPRIDAAALSDGERQFCLALVARKLGAVVEQDGRLYYLVDPSIHESLLESLAERNLQMRGAGRAPAEA